LNIDPSGIAGAPFAPVLTDGLVVKAAHTDLPLHPEALLYVLPAKSGYIGGDLLADILVSGIADQGEGLFLGLDLGTNGEIFLGNRERLMSCSAAAGPALEGARISSGMNARTGAIEGVRTETEKLQYRIIGNVKPRGLCGSGLVDLVAVLLHHGIVDREGLILAPGSVENDLSRRVVPQDDIFDFQVASAGESFKQSPIYLTQKDIRELQLAKGAVAAGIQILMSEMGAGVADITGIYLAGALGNYINPYSAMRIGMIPMTEAGKIKSLGNAASTGASMVLLSSSSWKRLSQLAHSIEYVELSQRNDFNQYFIENLDFPQTNIWS
jgi:uncharacterized 2Fe-2S/4Fe-4S cluster protein (DUF4445 family)